MKLVFFILLLSLGANAAQFKTGLVVPLKWKEQARFSAMLGVKAPETWDWRKQVKNVPMVKNQGACGSCWAFATSTVMEWNVAIAGKENPVLAPQELVSCDTSSFGCQGGFFTAFNYEKSPGLTFEEDYPYTASNSSCDASDKPHDYKIANWGYVGSGDGSAPSNEDLIAQIYSGGPVAVTVCATNAFMNYKGGIYSGSGSCQNHMVTLVGYDSKKEFWIMQNSWGTSWGEDGYMRIKFGANAVAQIAAFAVYKP